MSGSREALRRGLKLAVARCYVRVKGGNREPSWLVWEVFLPLLMISSVIYSYRSMGAPEEFVGFVIIGGAMMSFWLNVTWGMGSMFYWEKEKGNLELVVASGAPLSGLLLGMALGGMFNTSIRAAAIVLLGTLIFGARFDASRIPSALAVFTLTMAALYGLGMALASIYLMYARSGWRLSEALEEPMMFLSGMYYPISVFPRLMQLVACLFPLTIGIDGVRRSLVLGAGIYELSGHIIALSAMAAVSIYAAIWLLRRMERVARREGRLVLRWA
ncbi:hypothetical protein B6U99_05450 [Candidatus Geothermarchaeota archaeon ex4572_27]|nr:MAG: hypothetical protein B6U99_05450 [Candidatus Geothermarchaeota archaeon ex4572_27]